MFFIKCEVKIYVGINTRINHISSRGQQINPYFYTIFAKNKNKFIAQTPIIETESQKKQSDKLKQFFLKFYHFIPGTKISQKQNIFKHINEIHNCNKKNITDILKEYDKYYLQTDSHDKKLIPTEIFSEKEHKILINNPMKFRHENENITFHAPLLEHYQYCIANKILFSLDLDIVKFNTSQRNIINKYTNSKIIIPKDYVSDLVYITNNKNNIYNFYTSDRVQATLPIRTFDDYKYATFWAICINLFTPKDKDLLSKIFNKTYDELIEWYNQEHELNEKLNDNNLLQYFIDSQLDYLQNLQLKEYVPHMIEWHAGLSILLEMNSKGFNKRVGNFIVPFNEFSLFTILDISPYYYIGNNLQCKKKDTSIFLSYGFNIKRFGLCHTINIKSLFIQFIKYFQNIKDYTKALKTTLLNCLWILLTFGFVVRFKFLLFLIYFDFDKKAFGFSINFYPIQYTIYKPKINMTQYSQIDNIDIKYE